VRYEERGQGYRDVEKVGKQCPIPPPFFLLLKILKFFKQIGYDLTELSIQNTATGPEENNGKREAGREYRPRFEPDSSQQSKKRSGAPC